MHDLRSNSQNLINSLKRQGLWLIGYLLILSMVIWLSTEVWEKEAFSLDRSLLSSAVGIPLGRDTSRISRLVRSVIIFALDLFNRSKYF